MSTRDNAPETRSAYVTRDVCEAIHQEQREANRRTWEELRTLRRLVILLVIGGQVFSGSVNLVGIRYWLQEHAAHPHPHAVEMVVAARAETREELRDLRREIRDLRASVLKRSQATRPLVPPSKGDDP